MQFALFWVLHRFIIGISNREWLSFNVSLSGANNKNKLFQLNRVSLVMLTLWCDTYKKRALV